MADTDILVSEMTPASQINTTDLMIMTQPDAQAETGYSTKSGTVLQVANKMLKGTEYSTDLPDFTDKTPLGGLEELKADIKALLPVDSASGNPCNFETDIADTLVSLKAAIVASGGNGTPSTPIPIVGHSELNLVRCGKNLFDDSIRVFNSGTISFSDTTYGKTLYLQAGTYTFSVTTADGLVTNLYAKNLDTNTNIFVEYNVLSKTFTIPSGCNVALYVYKGTYTSVSDIVNAQLEVGSSSSAYAPYNGTPYLVSFGQTVYGGEYDANAGKVTITNVIIDMGDLPWIKYVTEHTVFATEIVGMKNGGAKLLCSCYEYVSGWSGIPNIADLTMEAHPTLNYVYVRDESYSTLEGFVTGVTGQKLVYELATPIEIDVSELSVDTIVGVNNIISDGGGDVEVQYRDSIQHYIDSKIASVQALIL